MNGSGDTHPKPGSSSETQQDICANKQEILSELPPGLETSEIFNHIKHLWNLKLLTLSSVIYLFILFFSKTVLPAISFTQFKP